MTAIDGPFGLIGGFVRARFEPAVSTQGQRARGTLGGASAVEGWVLLDPGMPQSSITRDAAMRLGLFPQNPRDRYCAFGVLNRTMGYKLKVSIGDFPPILVDAREVPEATDQAMQFVARFPLADATIIGALGTDVLLHFVSTYWGPAGGAGLSR